MKRFIRLMSVLLVFVMVFSFASCVDEDKGTDASTSQNGNQTSKDTTPDTPKDTGGASSDSGTTDQPTAPEDKFSDIAGEYLLDASNLGMPMQWFINITADGKFVISSARDYAESKGDGQISVDDGEYTFTYSDSTAEAPKTAKAVVEEKNLVFSTKVYVGKASLTPDTESGAFPTALIIAHESAFGTYYGEYAKMAMGTPVLYEFEVTLGAGCKYVFISCFTMGDNEYVLTEEGVYDIKDNEIYFTAYYSDGNNVENPAPVKGSIDNGKIKAAFKLSAMAGAPQEVEMTLAAYEEYEGYYYTVYEKAMGPMTLVYDIELELDAFGSYYYSTFDKSTGEVDYEEEGTYTVENGKIIFKSSKEGAAAVEGAMDTFTVSVKFPISSMVSTPVDLVFYSDKVNGMFMNMKEIEGKIYAAQALLVGNTFMLAAGEAESESPSYIVKGTFEIQESMMGTKLALVTVNAYTDPNAQTPLASVPDALKTFTLTLTDAGLTGELPLDLQGTKTESFTLSSDFDPFA